MASNITNGYGALPVVGVSDMDPPAKTTFTVAVALLIFACLTVGLRFGTRISRQHSFDQGDVWLMLGLLMFASYCFALIRGIQTSGGTLAQAHFTPYGIENFFKYLYAVEITFTATLTAVKISLLCLYTSIFRTHQFLHSARIVIALCVVWFIIFMSLVVFQCRPIHAVWDMTLVAEGKAVCVPFGKLIIAYETTNMVIDVVILSLPLFVIKSLQLPRTRKYAVACLFSLGGLVLIVCIFRTYYFAKVTNSTGDASFAQTLNWSTAELATAIMCASVPTYGHYFNLIGKVYSKLSSKMSVQVQSDDKRQNLIQHGEIAYTAHPIKAEKQKTSKNGVLSMNDSIFNP